MDVEEAPGGQEPSTMQEDDVEDFEEMNDDSGGLDGDQRSPVEGDQMAEEGGQAGALAGGGPGPGAAGVELLVRAGAEARALQGPGAWPRPALACSLCKRLFSSLEQLREHEYRHTLSLMTLSLDWTDLPQALYPDLSPSQQQHHHHHHHHPKHQSHMQLPLAQRHSLFRPALAEPTPGRYLCSQCPASFTLKSNADRHEKTIHFKKKLMQCAYCLKHFRDRTDLHRHLSSVHSKERGHTCPSCGKAFSTQKNLATHVKASCQVGAVPGTGPAGGGAGLGVAGAPGGDAASMSLLWGLCHEVKVESHGSHASRHHQLNQRHVNVEN